MNVVWFKKDLRISDHQPLIEACKYGEVFPLYVVEPSIWNRGNLSARHYQFVLESLENLSREIEERGGKLFTFVGEVEEVLGHLKNFFGTFSLFSHEEAGTLEVLARNQKVREWMAERNLPFNEYPANGVIHGRSDLKGFRTQWNQTMRKSVVAPPSAIYSVERAPEHFLNPLEKLAAFEVKGTPIRFGQIGGERHAAETLQTFLDERFELYQKNYDKPLQSTVSSSRLSPYLAWGNLSLRTVFHKTNLAMEKCKNDEAKKPLEAFLARLFSHDEAIQKHLLASPHLMGNPQTNEKENDEEVFKRWSTGRTGIPIIDACMRCLHKTGWLPYHLRLLVASFACNTLQLDWKESADALAKLFLDYEPGIHFTQVQIIAGVLEKKKPRLLHPIKEGKKLDPEGAFIRRYVPELSKLGDSYLHEPWQYPGFFQLNYEAPITDIDSAHRKAKMLLTAEEQNKTAKRKNDTDEEQLSFDLF